MYIRACARAVSHPYMTRRSGVYGPSRRFPDRSPTSSCRAGHRRSSERSRAARGQPQFHPRKSVVGDLCLSTNETGKTRQRQDDRYLSGAPGAIGARDRRKSSVPRSHEARVHPCKARRTATIISRSLSRLGASARSRRGEVHRPRSARGRDHPRSRGRRLPLPRVGRVRRRIIRARAGCTSPVRTRPSTSSDHPRVGGRAMPLMDAALRAAGSRCSEPAGTSRVHPRDQRNVGRQRCSLACAKSVHPLRAVLCRGQHTVHPLFMAGRGLHRVFDHHGELRSIPPVRGATPRRHPASACRVVGQAHDVPASLR
jgi:hypothetical protein